jgi:hypothetical protein
VTGRGRLTGIDMADNDDVDMDLLFAHVVGGFGVARDE